MCPDSVPNAAADIKALACARHIHVQSRALCTNQERGRRIRTQIVLLDQWARGIVGDLEDLVLRPTCSRGAMATNSSSLDNLGPGNAKAPWRPSQTGNVATKAKVESSGSNECGPVKMCLKGIGLCCIYPWFDRVQTSFGYTTEWK